MILLILGYLVILIVNIETIILFFIGNYGRHYISMSIIISFVCMKLPYKSHINMIYLYIRTLRSTLIMKTSMYTILICIYIDLH